MKKVALSLMALLALGTFAFAQDAAKLANTVTASAEVSWAYDVETGSNGFANSSDFTIVVPLAAAGSVTKGGEDTYGTITVKDIKVDIQNDNGTASIETDYDLSASIVSGPFTVGLGKPGYGYNNAAMMGPLSIDAWEDASIKAVSASAGGGLSVAYAAEMFTIKGLISSNGNTTATAAVAAGSATKVVYVATGTEATATGVTYTTLTGVAQALPLTAGTAYIKVTAGSAAVAASKGNDKSQYTAGVELSLTPAKEVTVAFDAFKDLYDTGNTGVSALLTLVPDAALKVTAGFDGSIVGTKDLVWDGAAAATYTLENADALKFTTFYSPAKSYLGAVNVNGYFETGVKFTEDSAKGFVENVGFSAYFKGYNLMNAANTTVTEGLPAFLGGTVDYLATIEEGKTVKPYAAFDFGMLHMKGVTKDNGLIFKAGVEAKVIANTTLTAEFKGGAISDDKEGNTTLFLTPFGEAGNKGVFKVTAKVAY